MPSTLSPQEFMELAELETQEPLLSLYFPLDPSGVDLRAKKLQLKNILNHVRSSLESRKCPEAKSKAMLEALEGLERNQHFLNPLNAGLAVLASLSHPQAMKVLALDFRPEESVTLADRYSLAPLMRLFGSSLPRTVLAISEGGLRMLKGTAQHLAPVELPENFPKDRDEVTRFERASGLDPRDSTQHRSGGGMSYHGEGPKESVKLEFTKRYYRAIGEALAGMLSEHETVLLAGVHEQLTLFRRLNPELPLLPAELTGNFETQPTEHFEHRALSVLQEVEQAENRLAVAKVKELGQDWWTTDFGPALKAACDGKVHLMYVNEASLGDSKLEELALEVLRHGGTLRALDADQLDSPFLARFRWSDSSRSESNVPI